MTKVVGILGGMGPEATALFFHQLVRLTPAQREQEHLRVIILNDPHIPDRNAHLLERGETPLPALVEGAKKLQDWGAEILAIPCNTAHYFWDDIRQAVFIPVLNIVEETIHALHQVLPAGAGTPIGILGTRATLQLGLYEHALRREGFRPLVPEARLLAGVQQAIRELKGEGSKDRTRERIQGALQHLAQEGARGIILGCTELGLLVHKLEPPVAVFDTLEILARATVREALKSDQDDGDIVETAAVVGGIDEPPGGALE